MSHRNYLEPYDYLNRPDLGLAGTHRPPRLMVMTDLCVEFVLLSYVGADFSPSRS